MITLFTGIGLFLVAFAVHVAWWRHRRPLRTGQTLILLLVGVIGLGWVIAIAIAYSSPAAARYLPADPIDWLQTLALALAIAAAYVMTYPAIEVPSPTLVIIDAIGRRGPAGFEAREIEQKLDDAFLVAPRVQDLLDEGLVELKDGRYWPTGKGLALARMFIAWRRLIRAGLGG